MTGRLALLAVVLAAVGPRALAAQQQRVDAIADSCAATDTATAWQHADSIWTARGERHWTNDALRHRLIALQDSDQAMRLVPGLADSLRDSSFVRRMAVRDSADAAALMAIVARSGWPTRTMVGAAGAHAAFLIAQHNTRIQPEALRRMRALPPAEVKRSDLALLEDRVLVDAGKPQRYGTQLRWSNAGQAMVFDSIADFAHLDARRAAAGLPPLGVYICLVRGLYQRPVIDPRPGGL